MNVGMCYSCMVVTPAPAKSLYDLLCPSNKVNHYGRTHQTVCVGFGDEKAAFRDRHTNLLVFMFHLWSRSIIAEPEVLVRVFLRGCSLMG